MEGDDVQCFGPFTQECCIDWCDNTECGIQCREEVELTQGGLTETMWDIYCSCECTGNDVFIEDEGLCCDETDGPATFVTSIVEKDQVTGETK